MSATPRRTPHSGPLCGERIPVDPLQAALEGSDCGFDFGGGICALFWFAIERWVRLTEIHSGLNGVSGATNEKKTTPF